MTGLVWRKSSGLHGAHSIPLNIFGRNWNVDCEPGLFVQHLCSFMSFVHIPKVRHCVLEWTVQQFHIGGNNQVFTEFWAYTHIVAMCKTYANIGFFTNKEHWIFCSQEVSPLTAHVICVHKLCFDIGTFKKFDD